MATHRNFFIFTVFIFFIFIFPQNSISKIYKWEDCTKPFNKYIAGVLMQRPADIQVVLPDLLNEYDEIPLIITLDPVDSHSKTYGYFTINDQPRSKAFEFILHAHREKTFQVNLKTKILKAGLNTIHFGSEHSSTIYKPYSIIKLHFGFHDKKKIQELMAKSHSGEISEKDKPKISMKPYSEDKIPPKIIITSHDTSRGIRPVQNRKKVTISGRATDENGIVEITVNNKDAKFDEEGNFETDIYLKIGKNRIVVSAMDIYENRANNEFTITRVASKTPSKAKIVKAAGGNYYALVIGNNNYKYLKKLQTATNDAMRVADALKLRYGFDIKLLLDADRDAILDAVNYFRRILKQDDQLLIYYAGHGSFDTIASKAYWLPVDAQRDNDKNWIIVDTITSNIKRISSNHILIVADSCYSGTFTRASAVGKLESAQKRRIYLNKMQAKKSRTLLASGGNEPVSDIGGQGHSVFGRAVLVGLNKIESTEFTAEELYIQYIKEMVAGSSDQTPEYRIIRNSGHEGGDFVFKRIN